MKKHTKILELFGVPASGKSTIAEYIVRHSLLENPGTKSDMYKDFSSGSLFYKMMSFNPRVFFAGLDFVKVFSRTEDRQVLSRSYFLKAAWCRDFERKYGKYQNIVSDHGIIQDFVTWERGWDLEGNMGFDIAAKSYLSHERDVFFVYCNVGIDIAIERIICRGRDSGRLDQLRHNPGQLYDEFVAERQRFLHMKDLLEEGDFKLITLDTDRSVEDVSFDLLEWVKG